MIIKLLREEMVHKTIVKNFTIKAILDDETELKLLVQKSYEFSHLYSLDEIDSEVIDEYDYDKYSQLDDDIKDRIDEHINELLLN